MSNILLVEDDLVTTTILTHSLQKAGHKVSTADRPSQAAKNIRDEHFDLIIMDVGLPEKSGLDFTHELRNSGYKGNILMLTGLNDTHDKVKGLDAGADDYLTKPFDVAELQARVRALLRRHAPENMVLKNGAIEMDLVSRKVFREGKKIDLTTREFSLLEFFMRNQDKVMDRNAIAQQVWGSEFDPDSNVIDVYVNHLRKKIDSLFNHKLLRTVVGQGYMLSRVD
jgi:two-component system, OmpR family, copper resistance phosphate regulon response regulator CusR